MYVCKNVVICLLFTYIVEYSVAYLQSVPSQVIMDPGSNPSWQEHSKPPGTFEHVPFPQGFPIEHSSVSVQSTIRPCR